MATNEFSSYQCIALLFFIRSDVLDDVTRRAPRVRRAIAASSGFVRTTVLIALAGAGPAAGEPAIGSYSCTADRAVGLQGDPTSGRRYGGRIELPAAEQRFGLSLTRTEVGLGKKCRREHPGVAGSDAYSQWWFCAATTELTFAPGKYAQPLRGDDRNIFRDRLSGWFHLADDLRYVFAYTDFAGNFFLEEGACGPD